MGRRQAIGRDGSADDRAGIAYHQHLAAGWTDRYQAGGFRRRRDFIVHHVLPHQARGEDWIDVGCGSGVFTRLMADRGARMVGVDGAAAMIAAARATAADGSGPVPAFRCAPVEALDVELGGEPARFDGALCFSVLEYLDDPAATVAILARLVRPGGRLLLSVPNGLAPVRLAQRSLRPLAARVGVDLFPYLATSRSDWSPRRLQGLLTDGGFTVERLCGFDPLVPDRLLGLVPASLIFATCLRAG